MNTNDFKTPKNHPYGMCSAYNDGHGKEVFLANVLTKHIENGHWEPVKMDSSYTSLVTKHGLLRGSYEEGYALTVKSKGLLFAHYGKD